MQGTIVKIVAGEGQQVAAGDTVVVLEAMKMEQPLTAHKDGTVTGLAVEIGQTVSAGTSSAGWRLRACPLPPPRPRARDDQPAG